MSVLITFAINTVLPILEKELITWEPEIQAEFLREVDIAANALATWIKGKIETIAQPTIPAK